MPARPALDFQAMNCPCRVELDGVSPRQAQPLLRQAQAEVLRIEAKYSRYRADSVTSQINQRAGLAQAWAVDTETAGLLNFAAQLHQESGGRFDLSSGVLRQVWDFRAGRVPTPEAIAALRERMGWERVEWQGQHLRLPVPGMELDFGGIGKEYAADRVATLLLEAGMRHGFINLGGDIRVLGPQANGQPWRFGIQHPRQPQQVLAYLSLHHGALATSGDYERFFEHQGQRYCHILNPLTGHPVRYWQSVSVMSALCLAAGALSTLAMLLEAQAPALLHAQGVAFLAVDEQGRVMTERDGSKP